jgi:hypothetical protein
VERALRRAPLGERGGGDRDRARRAHRSERQLARRRLDEGFLADELERSRAGELTEDCRDGACGACGVCGEEIGMELLA